MNITNLTGRMTKDIELRTTQSGKTVANFTLAVNRRFKSQGQPDADFFRCQAWGKTAEVLHQYTHKGSQIGITGRLQNRSYENQQGQNVEITEVIVESMDLLDSRNNGTQPADRPQSTYGGYSPVQTQNRSYGAGNGCQSGGYQYDQNVRPSHDNPYSPDEILDLGSDDLPF
ncbi:single-stranded DNA-binding protein [Faecalibaculum rodentium]|uniref:single-stranded DNA-binding protein n=1 Tax=Faecalibaculum rodentium TaxID=1702221 RepID=UPI0025B7927D|nr:single-stranded DNA-binding protein [Faecalibaculum rodentium]